MTLAELLALIPDNTTGEISAADMRAVVTGLWDYTASVQQTLNALVVNTVPQLQAAVDTAEATAANLQLQLQLDALETRVAALEGPP